MFVDGDIYCKFHDKTRSMPLAIDDSATTDSPFDVDPDSSSAIRYAGMKCAPKAQSRTLAWMPGLMIQEIAAALANKTVFVTGHTGFKGSWLALWLARLGARVVGYALPPNTQPNNFTASGVRECLADHFEADVRDISALGQALCKTKPDVVLHLAAQPLVRASYADPRTTFEVNVNGTINVLDCLRTIGRPCAVVCITTDKCYENREQVWGYRETDSLGGYDPYSASKAATEIAVSSYRQSFFPFDRSLYTRVSIATARAGNVIGGGDWAADRIVTELARAAVDGRPGELRNPAALRPWQHVLEPLAGYLSLAAKMVASPSAQWCEAWNFGPLPGDELPVGALADRFFAAWGTGGWRNVGEPNQPHEAGLLKLCIDKAVGRLGWRPQWRVGEAIERTASWFRNYYADPAGAQRACLQEIAEYERAMAAGTYQHNDSTASSRAAVARAA